jgi:hypothetical protein
MKRWALLLVVFATPWSSPLGCGGDGCLRNSDCAADEVCSAGSCAPETPAPAAGGGEANEAGETSVPGAGTTTSGSGGTAQAGSAGSSNAGTAGSESSAGQASMSEGGAAGAVTDPIDEGGAGFGGALELGGAGIGGAL